MKYRFLAIPLGAALVALYCLSSLFTPFDKPLSIRPVESANGNGAAGSFEVQDEVSIPGVKRIGVNLGRWTAWGAEQLCSNVLKNPGFEGLIDRALMDSGRGRDSM